jgi:hypothetical protein
LSTFPCEQALREVGRADFTENWELRTGSSATLARLRRGTFVMAEKKPQTYANHTRWDPPFHFFALPVFALLAVASMVYFIWRPGLHSALMFVVAAALATVVVKSRLSALRVQDRVIRLEERQRLALLMPEPLRSRIPELTEDQLIALRFASDTEVAKLAERALLEKLSRADIKKAIQTWRPDYWRV